MTVDPRSTCVVGVAQAIVRPEDGPAPEPLELWADVSGRAAADAGGGGVMARVDGLHVVYCQSWEYDDPAGRLAARLGIDPGLQRYSGIGGTVPQALVAGAAARIAAGETGAELIVMGEALHTVRRSWMTTGGPPAWSYPPAEPTPFPYEAPPHPAEKAHKLRDAWLTFAMRDIARRAARHESPSAYAEQMGRLMSRLTDVAATNPYAWFPEHRDPAALADPAPDNRYVGYPYTKRLCSMMNVDLAAAIVVTSHEVADELGVPASRRVYLHGAAYGEDPHYVAEHPDLARSEAMPQVFGAALGQAGVGIDDVAHLDLYSCFPSSLAFACDALGLALDEPRSLTVTGGLPYAGGAGSGYVLGSLAAMTACLRSDPGSRGLVTGVGMHMTKHAAGIYSTDPPPSGVVAPADLGPVVTAPRVIDEHPQGPARLATYGVVHGKDGAPTHAVVILDLPTGARAYAWITDGAWLQEAEQRDLVGQPMTIRSDPHTPGRNLAAPA